MYQHEYILILILYSFVLLKVKKNGWLDKIGLKNSDYCDTYLLFCPIFCIGCCKQLLLHQIVYT